MFFREDKELVRFSFDTGRHRLFMIPILSAGVETHVGRQHQGGNLSSTVLTMLMKDPVTHPNWS
jgi:hypothetical protein